MARATRFLGLGLAAVALAAAGCGTASTPAGLALKPVAVKVQQASWDLQGTFSVRFEGLGARRGYATLATRADVKSVRLVLTSPRLVEPQIKTVGPEELAAPVVTVSFTGVPAGDVSVKVQALDATGRVIGAKESASQVSVGQTTVLQMAVKLDAVTGDGNLGAVVTFEEPSPSPSPSPSASPTPTPAPSATPGPVLLESSRLVRHLFAKPDAEITLKNTLEAPAKAKVYAYFYSDNTLRDSQAREIPLEAGQRLTFTLPSAVYAVNKVMVVVK